VPEFGGVQLGIQAANGHAAAIRVAQTLEDFDGGGFAGAIRPEQAEHLAFLYGKADAAHGVHVAVMLDEIFDFQNGNGHTISGY
jgi:hypothetical protein